MSIKYTPPLNRQNIDSKISALRNRKLDPSLGYLNLTVAKKTFHCYASFQIWIQENYEGEKYLPPGVDYSSQIFDVMCDSTKSFLTFCQS